MFPNGNRVLLGGRDSSLPLSTFCRDFFPCTGLKGSGWLGLTPRCAEAGGGEGGRWVVGECRGQADPLPTSPGKMQWAHFPWGLSLLSPGRARARRGGGEQDAWDTGI